MLLLDIIHQNLCLSWLIAVIMANCHLLLGILQVSPDFDLSCIKDGIEFSATAELGDQHIVMISVLILNSIIVFLLRLSI